MSNLCVVCRNTDLRRLVELGWNQRMTASDISHAFGGAPSAMQIRKHLMEHKGSGKEDHDIPIEDVRPTRVRIEHLQKKMLDEIESRIQWAEERAAVAHENGNADVTAADYFDVLNPKVQASIASVIKMQDQTDKRDSKRANIAVDVMKLMGGAPPPSHLIEDGKTVEGEATDLGPVPEAE